MRDMALDAEEVLADFGVSKGRAASFASGRGVLSPPRA